MKENEKTASQFDVITKEDKERIKREEGLGWEKGDLPWDWISVKDHLPPFGVTVLVCSSEYPVFGMFFDRRKENLPAHTDGNQFLLLKNHPPITHWYPIPNYMPINGNPSL